MIVPHLQVEHFTQESGMGKAKELPEILVYNRDQKQKLWGPKSNLLDLSTSIPWHFNLWFVIALENVLHTQLVRFDGN